LIFRKFFIGVKLNKGRKLASDRPPVWLTPAFSRQHLQRDRRSFGSSPYRPRPTALGPDPAPNFIGSRLRYFECGVPRYGKTLRTSV
jgi:hypothetical protein